MKKLILSMGVGLFLYAFAYHVTVSVDNPMKLVTQEALVHASGVDCECRGVLFWKSCKAADEEVERQCAPDGTNNCSRYDMNC